MREVQQDIPGPPHVHRRNEIIGLAGSTTHKRSRILRVSARTVQHIKTMQATSRNMQPKKIPGSPRLTTRREDKILHRPVRSNRSLTAT